MKKIIFTVALVLSSFLANAQFFSVGVNAGVPVGDSSNATNFSYGVNAHYMLSQGEKFSYGIASGLQLYSGKNTAPDLNFLNVAGNANYYLSQNLSVGLDLGWSFGLSPDGNDGGGFYRPIIGYMISDKAQLNLSYSAVKKKNNTIANVGLGVMFAL